MSDLSDRFSGDLSLGGLTAEFDQFSKFVDLAGVVGFQETVIGQIDPGLFKTVLNFFSHGGYNSTRHTTVGHDRI